VLSSTVFCLFELLLQQSSQHQTKHKIVYLPKFFYSQTRLVRNIDEKLSYTKAHICCIIVSITVCYWRTRCGQSNYDYVEHHSCDEHGAITASTCHSANLGNISSFRILSPITSHALCLQSCTQKLPLSFILHSNNLCMESLNQFSVTTWASPVSCGPFDLISKTFQICYVTLQPLALVSFKPCLIKIDVNRKERNFVKRIKNRPNWHNLCKYSKSAHNFVAHCP